MERGGSSQTLLHPSDSDSLAYSYHADGLAEKPLFYDGYGILVWPDEPNSQRMRRQPFQYKGQAGYYGDAHTGLYYCHNRYYDPRLGSWLSRDPIGLDGGTNLYSYCGGNPVMFWDPSGLQVGPPKGLEVWIPVWGPGRDAVNEFQTGQYGWALFHTVVAISDVFLAKTIVVGIGKGISKVGTARSSALLKKKGVVQGTKAVANKAGIWKSGSNSWDNTRSWLGRQGFAAKGEPVHHGGFARNSPIGKFVPDAIKNQKWNLKVIKSRGTYSAEDVHMAIHGYGPLELNRLMRLHLGTPDWMKAFSFSTAGRAADSYGRYKQ